MASMSLVVYGAIGFGLLCMLFLLHELKNAPYDSPESEQRPSEFERRGLRSLPWE